MLEMLEFASNLGADQNMSGFVQAAASLAVSLPQNINVLALNCPNSCPFFESVTLPGQVRSMG
jgi:hypothetical protein